MMSTSIDRQGQDTGTTDKGKERYEINAAILSTQKPLTEPPAEDVALGGSRDAGMDPPTVPSSSASTSLTSIPSHLVSEAPNVSSTVRPTSRPVSRDTSPYPRSWSSTPRSPSTPVATPSGRPAAPRRSARTLAKGPERPLGPPELEAALTIAIRNLESDIYEWWCANQKQGDPVPTTAYLKGRSPRIRKAAEAVDEADRLVNEAVYGKTRKGRSGPRKSQGKPETQASPSADSQAAFGHLELTSQNNSPLRSTNTEGSSVAVAVDGQPRRSARNKETTGD